MIPWQFDSARPVPITTVPLKSLPLTNDRRNFHALSQA